MKRQNAQLVAGLTVAYGAFAATFLGPRERFWQRMTLTGATLGTLALAQQPDLRNTRVRAGDVPRGLAAAVGLYVIFQGGDRFARRFVPQGGRQIDVIYALDRLRPRAEIAARLALVIGPAEELFWRGLVERRLRSTRLGRWKGAAVAAAAYGGAHIVARNFTLFGAASVAGAYWSALAAAGLPMGSLIVSHVAWDVWIFLLAPTNRW